MRAVRVTLEALHDVDHGGAFYLARSETPWLRIAFDGKVPDGHWLRITYATSFFDPLVRPILRFIIGDAHHDEILPGALFGRAIWLGFVPKGTQEIWISPTNRPGPFSFRIEQVSTVAIVELLGECMLRHPGHCLIGVGAHLIGLRYIGNTKFHRALSATPLHDYPAWLKMRSRPLDLAGFDLPRHKWESAPHIRFVACGSHADKTALQGLLNQLEAQPYPHWSLTVVSSSRVELSTEMNSDERIMIVAAEEETTRIFSGLRDADIIAPVALSDEIPSYSIAVLAWTAQQQPAHEIFYGDEELQDSNRRRHVRLRPDWSPISSKMISSLNDVVFFRVAYLKRCIGARLDAISDKRLSLLVHNDANANDINQKPDSEETNAFLARDLTQISIETAQNLSRSDAVFHIRRVMRTRICATDGQGVHNTGSASKAIVGPLAVAARPCATIIIPTKNHARLLRTCVESLRTKSFRQDIEVIVVDNGSTQKEARSYLESLASDRRFRVIRMQDAFNFAKLCNHAAAEARARSLVFLNNDTEVVSTHWLESLIYWASQADVGAVGAKLIYPNGRVQHAGVVLGIDRRAGHFQRMLKKDDPGYFGRLLVPHEVSAVTGACLALEKQKFQLVGGFDEINLPVELNDIDLCLRLAERGLKSVCSPEAVLIHHESASRGMTPRPNEVYAMEHRYFCERWMHRLRDDPYFHPALSLHSLTVALG